MSYILDALRKAERDRQVRRVPTLATAHGNAELGRWPQWIWGAALGGALAVGAALAVSLFAPGRSAPVAVTPAPPPPPVATAPAAPSPSVEPATPAPSAVERAPAPPPVPAVERPPGRASTVPRVAASPPRAAPVESRAAPVEPSAHASSAARPADAHRTPPVPEAPAVSALRPGAAPAPTPATAAPTTGPDASPSPRTTEVPAASPPAALASAPPVEATSGGGAVVPSSAVARLTLDVLVYSDVPAERLVFINGRKYVEGQAVTDDAVVEQITADGAILRQGDRRLILRPKLNPYARPGSP